MTSPNEWWKEEPYATTIEDPYCLVDHTIYNIEAIIEEVKRRERGETTVKDMGRGELFARWFKCLSCDSDEIIEDTVFCPHCGLKINWK